MRRGVETRSNVFEGGPRRVAFAPEDNRSVARHVDVLCELDRTRAESLETTFHPERARELSAGFTLNKYPLPGRGLKNRPRQGFAFAPPLQQIQPGGTGVCQGGVQARRLRRAHDGLGSGVTSWRRADAGTSGCLRRFRPPANSDRLGQEASIYAQVNTGNEATGLFAGEENRRPDEFGGVTETRHGGVAQNHLAAGSGGPILIKQ
jgi:hypothetical protein